MPPNGENLRSQSWIFGF